MEIDTENRKRQMCKLRNWLLKGLKFESGADLARELDISQSTISKHLIAAPDAAVPKDELRLKYCNFLNNIPYANMACKKWTIASFTAFLDSDMEPDAFIKYLENEPVPIRMSVRDIHSALTDAERLEFVELYITDLKKNCYLYPSVA